MREFKFRAFDTFNNRFVNMAHESVIHTDGRLTISHGMEITQYTGLKDKNGVEIYEGDLLRDVTPALSWTKGGQKLVVCEWDEKYTCFHLRKISGIGDELTDGTQWTVDALAKFSEVIGNIYENPELMKDNAL